MPSIRYYNSSAPFWDFIANLETQGQDHPFFARSGPPQEGPSSDEEGPAGPWGWGHRRWHHGPPPPPPPPGAFPHHGRFAHRGPPPPAPPADAADETLPAYEQSPDTVMAGDEKDAAAADPETSVPREKGKAKEGRACEDGCRGGAQARRGGGRCGGRGGYGGRFGVRGGPWWAHQRRGGFPGPWGTVIADLFGENAGAQGGADEGDFKPDVDVFDAEDRFIIHVSLPGAKKEDVGVNWDAEKSEISIAGVTYRPADEETLKTLAMDERKVGPFERKVRLGSRANPAQIDADAISAKLEDGILIIEVPKLDKDYVEVKKVDIE